VTRPSAENWLNAMLANYLQRVGQITLSPTLNEAGMLIGDLTVSSLSDDHFQIIGTSSTQAYHMRWFLDHLPDSGVEKSFTRGFVPVELIANGEPFKIEILRDCHLEPLVTEPLFDPTGERIQGYYGRLAAVLLVQRF